MSLTHTTIHRQSRNSTGTKVLPSDTMMVVGGRTNRGLSEWRGSNTTPRYISIGHTFTKDGARVDVVRPWKLAKAAHRHNEYLKRLNNAALLKGDPTE